MVPEDDKVNPLSDPDSDKENSMDGDEGLVVGKSGRHRRRIKIRKRIRIKKKPSAKKQVKKIAERVFWAVIIIGFIASLIVMIVQLDIKDEKFKQKRKASPGKTTF